MAGINPSTPPGTPSKKQLLLHIPSETILALPIRRYISETLICHVLGHPSYSLACLLVSATSQYLGVQLPSKQISIEDVCKMVGDSGSASLECTVQS